MNKNAPEAMSLPERKDGETVADWVARTYAMTDHDAQAAEFLEYFAAVIERAGVEVDYMDADAVK